MATMATTIRTRITGYNTLSGVHRLVRRLQRPGSRWTCSFHPHATTEDCPLIFTSRRCGRRTILVDFNLRYAFYGHGGE